MYKIIEIKQLDTVLDIMEVNDSIGVSSNDISFIAGSIIEPLVNKSSIGMGNTLSDIDAFIIAENLDFYNANELDYSKDFSKILFRKINNVNFDIEIYSKKVILDLTAQLNKIDFKKNDIKVYNQIKMPNGLYLDKFTSFLHRLFNSIPIGSNIDEYDSFKSNINRDNYHKLLIRIALNNIENMFDDVLGNLSSGEFFVALTIARDMLLEAMKAYIFSKGESVDRKKWILLKFKNMAVLESEAATFFNEFVKLNFEDSLKNNNDYNNNIKSIIKLSNAIIDNINNSIEII